MSNASTARVAERALVLMGQSPPSAVCSESGDGLPFIQGNAEFRVRFPVPRLRCSVPTRIADAGDLLLSVRAPVGELNEAPTRLVIGRGLAALRFPQADSSFAWHAIRWSASALDRVAQGSTFVAVSRQDVEDLRIPWHGDANPRIAAVLDTVDEAIEKSAAVIAKLRQVRAGLLHDLLTRGLDEHGQLRDPIAHPEQFQDSPLGRISRNWCVRRLNDLADVDRGKFGHRPRNEPRFYGGEHPFVQTGDIANAAGDVIVVSTQTLNDQGAVISREFPANTIAITIAANIADTAILGRAMFLTDSVVGAVVKPPNSVRYVELCIRRAKPRLEARAPQTAQMNINLQDLRPLAIPVPIEPAEQNRISEIYETHADNIRKEQANLEMLRCLKTGLMTDLLTGRVRVPESLVPVEARA